MEGIDNGATVLFLDSPSNLEFGIDFNMWKIGPRFKGLTNIPAGLHLLYYNISSMFNIGYFHYFKPSDILVFQWDSATEEFKQELDNEQLERFKFNLPEFKLYLGIYPTAEIAGKWNSFVNYITPRLLHQIVPAKVSSMHSSSKYTVIWNEARKSDLLKLNIPENDIGADSQSENWINFTDIDLKRSYPVGSKPCDITLYSLDKSFLLDITIGQNYADVRELLGELQLSFILFHNLQLYDAFEQWKILIQLICGSSAAIEKYQQFFVDFLNLFLLHLQEFPADFFQDELKAENFIRSMLITLACNIREADFPVSQMLSQTLSKVVDYVQDAFGWDVPNQYQKILFDDDAPVIVEEY